MAKTILLLSGTPDGVSATTTEYFTATTSHLLGGANETDRQALYRTPGTFSHLYVFVTANTTTAASTVRLRIDATNANINLSIPAGVSGLGAFEDTVNTDTIAGTGQKVSYRVTAGSGGNITIGLISMIFTPTNTGETVSKLAVSGAVYATASASRYNQLSSEGSNGVAAEASAQTRLTAAGTLRNFSVYVNANARTTTSTIRIRKNGANSTILVSVPGGASNVGWFEDTTHTESVAVNDTADYVIEFGTGTENLQVAQISIEYVTTNGIGYLVAGRSGAFQQTDASTTYPPIGGSPILAAAATEANNQLKTRLSLAFSKMTISISPSNGVNAVSTLTFRKNGVNGNQTISIPSSGVGFITDTTNMDVCSASDLVNLQLVTPDVTGTQVMNVRHFSVQYTPLTEVSFTNIHRYSLRENVQEDNIRRYSSRENIDKPNIRRYSLFSLLNIPSIRRYSSRQFLDALNKRRYTILQYLNAQNIRRYSSRQYVENLNIRRYGLRQLAQAISTRVYDVAAAIGVVAAHSIRRYTTFEYVSAPSIRRYSLRQLVENTSIRLYDIAAALFLVTAESIRRYSSFEYVSAPSIRKWNLLQQISAETIRLYNILEPTILITAENIRRYDLKQLITGQTIRRYNIIEFGKKFYSMLGAGAKIELDQAAKILQDFIRGGYPQ